MAGVDLRVKVDPSHCVPLLHSVEVGDTSNKLKV